MRRFLSTRVQAVNGDVASMIELAKMYLSGKGTTKDEEKAYHWFDEASEESDIAIAWVADCYLVGVGVGRDYHEGYQTLLEAAHGDIGESI